jgi:hypothetical protein
MPIARTVAGLLFVLALLCCGPVLAQELPKPLSDPVTGREAFLAVVIVAMMFGGLVSFFLFGRVSEKTHVALALLSVLAGGFSLLVLFGSFLYENPVAAIFVLLLLIGMFKLMSLFESGRAGRKQSKE